MIPSITELKENYFYKEDLISICKKLNLPLNGNKIEIRDRIIAFLQTGKITRTKTNNISTKTQLLPQNLDEVMPTNYSSSELYRSYFKKIIGDHFHFTAYMMNYRRLHPNMTFKEYIDEWNAEYERRKDKNYKPEIMKSTEYNQYVRDFFADKNNKGKKLKDIIKAWNYRKNIPGDKKYNFSDLENSNNI